MARRASTLIAWSIAAASVGLLVVAYLFAARNGRLFDLSGSEAPEDLYVPLIYVAVGLIVATRRRTNPIGWLFLSMGVLIAARGAAEEYAIHGFSARPTLPGTDWALWFQGWILSLGAAGRRIALNFCGHWDSPGVHSRSAQAGINDRPW